MTLLRIGTIQGKKDLEAVKKIHADGLPQKMTRIRAMTNLRKQDIIVFMENDVSGMLKS